MKSGYKKFTAVLLCVLLAGLLPGNIGGGISEVKAEDSIKTSGQMSWTVEEAARIVKAHYKNQLEKPYYGDYTIAPSETKITNKEYRFVLRFAISDQRMQELLAQGVPPTSSMFAANTLAGMVTVNRNTGEVSAEGGGFSTIDLQTWNIGDKLFADVYTRDWYYYYVMDVYDEGIMKGLNDYEFGPTQPLARAQFAVILHRMSGMPEITYAEKFPDVPDAMWYTQAILWANSIDVVKGNSNSGLFGVSDNINREQMAVMLYRYAEYMGYDTSMKVDFSSFSDAASVNEFAYEAMQWAVGNGIITGKDNGTRLDPQGGASRAECAAVIMRFTETYR